MKSSAAIGAASLLPKTGLGQVTGGGRLKVGLVGCGGRGTGALMDMWRADNDVEIHALADLFPDKVKQTLTRLDKFSKKETGTVTINVPADRQFSGWDACDKLLQTDVDVVILASTPVFRPLHAEKAIKAKKHLFVEKPVCVDATGGRKMFELADLADKSGLSIVAGTQRRYHSGYQEAIQRVWDGQIGEITGAQCYWLSVNYVHVTLRTPEEMPPEEMEYQIRNWFSFIWASGDHIVEQHVHNLDVIAWILQKSPVLVSGLGGRGVGPDLPPGKYGDRFTHFAVEYDYGDNLYCHSSCRQEPGANSQVMERIVGTKGVLETSLREVKILGEQPWKAARGAPELVEEHRVLLNAIKNNEPVNKLRDVTESCMIAIAGRISAYTGKKLKYGWVKARSRENFLPAQLAFGTKPIGSVPVPGKHKLM